MTNITTKKEMCTVCKKYINFGQKLCVCHICNKIIHGKCVSENNFFFKNGKMLCSACCVDASPHELRYNPFDLITSKNQTDKFYDTEPVEFDPSFSEISSLLQKCKSNTVEDLKTACKDFKNNFSTYFLNIDGNHSNFDYLSIELDSYQHKFSVIGIVETNVEQINGNMYQLPGYITCYQDKIDGKLKGSGVALYIHDDFNFVIEEKISSVSKNLESIFVRITNTTEPLLVGSVYRPPNGEIDKFYEEIETIFTQASKNVTYIMGDYNIDLFKNNLAARTFENIIYSNGFAPLISTTTHKKPGCSNSCINNIISNNISQVVYTGSISEKLLHHFPIFQLTELPKDAKKCVPEVLAQYYDYSNSKIDLAIKVFSKIADSLYSKFKSNNTVEENFDEFLTKFKLAIDETCKLEVPKTTR